MDNQKFEELFEKDLNRINEEELNNVKNRIKKRDDEALESFLGVVFAGLLVALVTSFVVIFIGLPIALIIKLIF